MVQRYEGSDRPSAEGLSKQMGEISQLASALPDKTTWLSRVDRDGPRGPYEQIRASIVSREDFVGNAMDTLNKATPDDLLSYGVTYNGAAFSFDMLPYLPLARREHALLMHHDGNHNTNPKKPRLFKLGGNVLYFEGEGKLVGIDVEANGANRDFLDEFCIKEDGTVVNLAKVNFSFGGPMDMGITGFPKKGDTFKLPVDRLGRVENTGNSYPEIVRRAAQIALPEGLLGI